MNARRRRLEALVHEWVVKRMAYGVVVQDGAIHHEVMRLVVSAVDNQLGGLVL